MDGRKWRLTAAFAAMALTCAALIAHAGPKVQYGWKWAKGKSYEVRMITDTNTPPGQASSQMTLGFGYRLDVTDVNAQGEATVNGTVTWVKVRERWGTRETVYDSADKDHPFPWEGRDVYFPAGLVGETFTVRLTPQGQARDIRGLAAMRDSMGKKIPEGPAKQQVMEGITEQQLAVIVSNILDPLAIYPSTSVGEGDSWDRRETLETPPCERVTKWTLKSRGNNLAIIEAETVMTSRQPGSAVFVRSHGQIEIDELTGRIRHSTTATWSEASAGKNTSATTFEMTERKAPADR